MITIKELLSIAKAIAIDDFRTILTVTPKCVTVNGGIIAAVIKDDALDVGEGVVTWPALEAILRIAHLVHEVRVTTVTTSTVAKPVTLSTLTAHLRGTVLNLVSVLERSTDTYFGEARRVQTIAQMRTQFNPDFVSVRPAQAPTLPAPLREQCEVNEELWRVACRAMAVVARRATVSYLAQPQPLLRLLWATDKSSVNIVMTLRNKSDDNHIDNLPRL